MFRKMKMPETINHPLCGCASIVIQKNYLSVYNKVVQAILRKGKSALMIFDKHANLKYKFGNRHFWAEGYYVSTVGLNEATIKKYIQEQEKQDIAMDKSDRWKSEWVKLFCKLVNMGSSMII